MRVHIHNRQALKRMFSRRIASLVRFFVERLSTRRPAVEWGDVAVLLTDNAGIQDVNRAFLSKSAVTDVISFAYKPIPGDPDRWCADIVVNVQRALLEGDHRSLPPSVRRRHGVSPTATVHAPRARGQATWSPSKELALYIAHGCDHLSDASDATAAGRRRMRRRELECLRQAEKEGSLGDLYADSDT